MDDPHDDARPRGAPIEPTFGWAEELQDYPERPAAVAPGTVAAAVVAVALLIIWLL